MADNKETTDLLVRVGVLEVETKYTKEAVDGHTSMLNDIGTKVDDIRSRLDKQNGTIPHMALGLTKLSEDFGEFRDFYMKDKLEEAKGTTETTTKVKLMWAAGATILVALIGFVLKLLLGS